MLTTSWVEEADACRNLDPPPLDIDTTDYEVCTRSSLQFYFQYLSSRWPSLRHKAAHRRVHRRRVISFGHIHRLNLHFARYRWHF